jgi:LemA protein
MALVAFLLIVGLLVAWVVGAYNGLVRLKNQVANALKQIDVQLKRRHDLIPNLVNTVKGAMSFERETLEAVISARNTAITVRDGVAKSTEPGTGVGQMAAAEAKLSGALSRLMAVVEAYPDLKATANVAQLQEELTSTENKIAFARQLYNDTATEFNTKREQFPTNLLAATAAPHPAELWEIEEAGERTAPVVNLGR